MEEYLGNHCPKNMELMKREEALAVQENLIRSKLLRMSRYNFCQEEDSTETCVFLACMDKSRVI